MHQSNDAGAGHFDPNLNEGGFAPYPAYKDSGTEWLGEIPAHWEVKRLKEFAKNVTIKAASIEAQDVYIALEHIRSWTGGFSVSQLEGALDSQVKHFQVGDILFGKLRPYLAKVARPRQKGICSGELLVLRPMADLHGPFLEHRFLSKDAIDLINSSTFGAKMPRAEWEFIRNMQIAVPPDLEEQQAIADFLDRETAKIDTLIEKQERLIELLQEKRIALISHAVTKGLDPSVPMKDSGIEWLGEIPAHWEVKQLGQIGIFRKCNGGTKEDESPDGLPCVRYGDLYTHHNLFIRQCCSYISSKSAIKYTLIQYGDILFAGSGETLDEIAKSAVNLIDTEVYCGGDVILLRLDIEADAHFMGYVVGAPQAVHQKALMGRGITVIHIYGSQLKYLSVAVPPTEEQQAIADFLNHETAKIDKLISKTHQVIELQKEFRSALISAAVTGKIDVQQASVSTAQDA